MRSGWCMCVSVWARGSKRGQDSGARIVVCCCAHKRRLAARSTTTRLAGLANGYFGTCGTWPGGRSRAAGDTGPGVRSQRNAIDAAIEQAASGSSLLRLSVHHFTKSRSCSSGSPSLRGTGHTRECAFAISENAPLSPAPRSGYLHGQKTVLTIVHYETPPKWLPTVLELNSGYRQLGARAIRRYTVPPPPLQTLVGLI